MFASSQPLRALWGPQWLRGAPTRTPQTAAGVPLARMGFVEQLCNEAAVRDPALLLWHRHSVPTSPSRGHLPGELV